MVPIGSQAKRGFKSYQLSRYACYLIVMNGDGSKKIIALGQTYFAVKTRQQELIENFDQMDEDAKRLAIRKEMIEHNKLLVATAKDAGVESSLDYAIFQNYKLSALFPPLLFLLMFNYTNCKLPVIGIVPCSSSPLKNTASLRCFSMD